MSEDLKRYNHLNYESNLPEDLENEGFVDFLFKNSQPSYKEPNEQKAWDHLAHKLAERRHSKRNYWLKVAASVAILLSVTLSVLLVNSDAEQITIASADDIVTVTFPDGSTGILNDQSQFSYPETFGLERRVSFSGEAYFDIKKSKKPFIINANGVDVKVLGTAFNLITTDSEVSLFVDRGLVAFSKEGKETKVSAGKEAIFNKKTGTTSIKDIPASNIMSWRNGDFKFENTPLNKALEDLGDYYGVEFKLSNTNLKSCRISASIEDKSLDEVLELIETILDVKTKLKDKLVKISGKGC